MESTLTKVLDEVPATESSPSKGPSYKVKYFSESEPTLENVKTAWDLFQTSVKKYPNNNMLGRREFIDGQAGKYVWQKYSEVFEEVKKISSAIKSSGIENKSQVGIYGANCPEWVISMEACNSQSNPCVPLYDSLGANAVEFIINHAEISLIFVQDKKIAALLKALPSCKFQIKVIVSMGEWESEQRKEVEEMNIRCFSWAEFRKFGEDNPSDFSLPEEDDICTIMYTSGTTGDPKGVLLKHRSVVSFIASASAFIQNAGKTANFTIDENDVFLSFLPLAHIFDRCSEEFFYSLGASVGFWQGDVKKIIDDVGELKPTMFFGVPRIFDKIYAGVKARVADSGFVKKYLFDTFYASKLKNLKNGLPHDHASYFGDKIVFNKVKQRLGGRVKLILSGGAPLSPIVEEFLKVTFCAPVVQGYGLTETCSGGFISEPDQIEQASTIGPPIPSVEVRLESVPDMNYDALATPPRGEICLRAPFVFSGYHKRDDLMKDAFDAEGWFHTGDVGEWQPKGYMKVIDRKKNIFKLSQGEYIAVENLENVYGSCPLLEQIWVYGNSFESCLVAIAVPKPESILPWAKTANLPDDISAICQSELAKKYVLDEITAVGKKAKLKGFEMIRGIHLDPDQFDIEKDLITPTFKKKRPQLLKYYQEHIDKMYEEIHKAEPKGE